MTNCSANLPALLVDKMRIRTIEDRGAFAAAWRRAAAEATREFIPFFMSGPWVETLMASAPVRSRLLALEARRGGAWAPCGFFGVRGSGGVFSERPAFFLESGDEGLDRIYPEYCQMLPPARDPALAAAMFAEAFTCCDDIDAFHFRNCRQETADAVAKAAEAAGFAVERYRSQPTFQVNLAALREEEISYLGGLPKSVRQKIGRAIRNYEKRGPVAFVRAETPEAKAAAFETLIVLHNDLWRSRGEEGAFANKQLTDFVEKLIADFPEFVDFVSLSVDGDIIGALLNFVHNGQALNYQSGLLIEHDSRLAPGFVLHAMAIQHYCDEGYDVYDFLAGDVDYKRRLARREGETLTSLVALRPGLRRNARNLVRTGRNALRDALGKRRP